MPRSGIKKLLARNELLRKSVYRVAVRLIVRPYIARLNVPVIAITGTNGKTTITRLLHKIYLNAGYSPACCCTSGVLRNDAWISEKDESDAGGAWKAARGKDLDILILETARGGLIKYGLGFNTCQVGIVTNVYEDHLGYDGINTLAEMAALKSRIPRNTDPKGTVILNGDDAHVRAMAARSRARAIYFVLESDPAPFENVFFLDQNCICKKMGGKTEKIIPIDQLPITSGGIQRYNIANAMAVLAAMEGMKSFLPVSDTTVRATLKEFGNDPFDNLERFHLVSYAGETCVLLFAKNPASLSHEMDLIRTIREEGMFQSVVGILSAPGNRHEKYFKELSQLAAPLCDAFFVRPPAPHYLRGRDGREIVRLLSSALPKDKILDQRGCTLDEVIALSNKKLAGKKLFVVFFCYVEAQINIKELLKEATQA